MGQTTTKSDAMGRFERRLVDAKKAIEKSGLNEALIIHHDEADGLCSGALTKVALERLGLETQQICLDKLYPEVVRNVESGPRRVIAYSDIGSGHVAWLSKWNKTNNLVLALDHHATNDLRDPSVFNINPELDGFSGEHDACSSSIAFLFARAVDPSSDKLAPLAIIGSIEIPGEARGLNQLPLDVGEKNGSIRRFGKRGLKLELFGTSLSPSRASTVLNVLGSVGYYQQGPEAGINACLNGFNSETLRWADKLEEERKAANQRMLGEIRVSGLTHMKGVQWFNAQDNYQGMSGKVVGSFCSYLSYQRQVNPMKYLIGMMNVSEDVPGWGRLPSPLVKVSGRAPQPLVKMIERHKRAPLSEILPNACEHVGGFGDGHTVAASGVFPVGAQNLFLEKLDGLAQTGS